LFSLAIFDRLFEDADDPNSDEFEAIISLPSLCAFPRTEFANGKLFARFAFCE
jgi:hypothetical protein